MVTEALRIVLGDQLTRNVASLADLDPERDVVLMAEVRAETTYVRHHKQKIALVLAAMRHFADDLRAEGVRVDYIALDDPENAGDLPAEIERAAARHEPNRIVLTAPGEHRLLQAFRQLEDDIETPVEIREDDRFFASRARFRRWAEGRKQLRMEYFYRDMRRETGILMDEEGPVEGRWNFDPENRKRLPKDVRLPPAPEFAPDATTTAVLDLVEATFPDHFGDLRPFAWAVTRADALVALDDFVEHRLARFGDYQDAMAVDEDVLFHGAISPYLNIGLLDPREVCDRAEAAYRAGAAPINAVEGFVRQILGWREYVRGIYWLKMPDYADSNALNADRPLPDFYWTGDTSMRCLAEAIGQTKRRAYAHHIQRLMLTGNFALLAGIAPAEVEAWYLIVYADAFEWVELPNTHGMALFADGGLLASKPYAASGAYIDRMSDYCAGCRYDVRQKLGPEACPFNYLYWDFLSRNRRQLGGNPRLKFPYKTLDGFPDSRRRAIREAARDFLDGL